MLGAMHGEMLPTWEKATGLAGKEGWSGRVAGKPTGQEANHNQVHVKATIMDSNSLLLILKWTFGGRKCRALCVMTLGSVALCRLGVLGFMRQDLHFSTHTLILMHEETKHV